ncbi:MAG: 50S ribosomal protein L15e [Candidatus Diapherotrites archaeon]|nr:50S ribosomal protein L15e [Candidatus Diapherotrites archaeon]
MSTSTQLVKETFQNEFKGTVNKNYDYKALYRQRMFEFRNSEDKMTELEKPTNLPRARSLGYKAKQGIKVIRIGVRKGGGMHTRPNKARRPKRMGVNKLTRRISIQGMAEQRVQRKYSNMQVLNSYKVGEDGRQHYYEVIIVDPIAPTIQSDKDLKWLAHAQHRKRALRGLTSAQKKSRGLKDKSKTFRSKNRPSRRANNRTA